MLKYSLEQKSPDSYFQLHCSRSKVIKVDRGIESGSNFRPRFGSTLASGTIPFLFSFDRYNKISSELELSIEQYTQGYANRPQVIQLPFSFKSYHPSKNSEICEQNFDFRNRRTKQISVSPMKTSEATELLDRHCPGRDRGGSKSFKK